MTQDEIIEMARQAASTKSFHEFFPKLNIDVLEAFAKLVEERTAAKERADEREACAKECDKRGYNSAADVIRARGEA
jgi:hypothetical protein